MIDPISSDALLSQLEQLKSQSAELSKVGGAQKEVDANEFKNVLGNLMNEVDQAQKQADVSLKSLATGESTNIQEVVMKMEQADVSFNLMVEIRNKLVSAYKEIMSGQ